MCSGMVLSLTYDEFEPLADSFAAVAPPLTHV
jgi:hypothetical protein